MIEKMTIIKNRAGIHARPAALIVQTASRFQSQIFLKKDDEEINAKSIMGILTLGAGYKTELIISAEGDDEQDMVNHIMLRLHNLLEGDSKQFWEYLCMLDVLAENRNLQKRREKC